MDGKESITFAFLISLIGIVITCINFFIARRKDIASSTQEAVSQTVEMKMLIKQVLEKTNLIQEDVKTLKGDIKELNNKWHETDKTLSEVVKEQRTMWKRIDELNKEK